MGDPYKILQIIQCNGWYAAYREGDTYFFDPLICWALMEIKEDRLEYQKIVGIRASDAASPEGYYPFADSFAGYCAPNDFTILGEKLKDGLKPRNSWGEP